MRFVDGDQGDFNIPQALEEAGAHQAFRRDIEKIELTCVQFGEYLASGLLSQGGIIISSPDSAGPKGIDLILHQGNQRRHDDTDAISQQCRQLEAERLASARRHQHKRILSAKNPGDDFLLQRTKRLKSEDTL